MNDITATEDVRDRDDDRFYRLILKKVFELLYPEGDWDDGQRAWEFTSPDGKTQKLAIMGSNLQFNDDQLLGGTITRFTIIESNGHKTGVSNFGGIDAGAFQSAVSQGGQALYYFLTDIMDGATNGRGGGGDDAFELGDGNDSVAGGAGNDTAWKFRNGNLSFDGGDGSDTLTFQSAYGPYPTTPIQQLVVDLAAGTGTNPYGGTLMLKGVENIVGTANADIIDGNDKANQIGDGRYDVGADKVRTFGGNDAVRWGFDVTGAEADGGEGSDTLVVVLTVQNEANVFDLTDPARDKGVFARNTAINFENLLQSNDLLPIGSSIDFVGNSAANKVGLYSGGTVELAGGNDTFYELGKVERSVDGGAGKDTLSLYALSFGDTDILDLANQSHNTGAFAGSTYKNFEVFCTEIADAWEFRGTGGQQIFQGGDGDETALGRAGNDGLTGGSGNDRLDGGTGNDTLKGGGWADYLVGGAGNDIIDGGKEKTMAFRDDDIAVYSGKRSDYHVSFKRDVVTIDDDRKGSPDGTDKVSNVERFDFHGKLISLADLIGKGPQIKGAADGGYTVKEGVTKVADLKATDSFGDKEGHGLTYSVVTSIYAHGTDDGFDFTIDAKTGKLAFKVQPDFEIPTDENKDNVYSIIVRVTDSYGINDDITFDVHVANAADANGHASHF